MNDNDDLISRQAAVELSCNVPIAPLIQGEGIHYEDIIFTDHIKRLPIVQPEQKTARWLINSDGYYPYCSACKGEPKNNTMTDFCPKCGAKMVHIGELASGSVAK